MIGAAVSLGLVGAAVAAASWQASPRASVEALDGQPAAETYAARDGACRGVFASTSNNPDCEPDFEPAPMPALPGRDLLVEIPATDAEARAMMREEIRRAREAEL